VVNGVAEAGRSANGAQAQRWNGESGRYWIAHRERHLAGHQLLLPRLFGAAQITPGERVLDVGCGCGATTIMAAHAVASYGPGSRGESVGLDLSEPMLQVAQRLAAQANVANVGFVQGDAQVCPLRRQSFDVIISSFGVMFFADPAEAFASLAAVLRPRGRLAFLCWQHDMQNEVFAIPLQAFGAHTQLPGPAVGDLFADPQQVRELLASAGWREIQIEGITEPAWMGSDVSDVMRYVRGMPMIRSLAANLGDRALTERVLGAIAEQYAVRQRPDGVWVRAAAWLVTAHRA
jgi:ubiquinone/menaquinone biosynthesis C-methylase UbiE